MPAIALADGHSTVFSKSGSGKGCKFPKITETGSHTYDKVVVGPNLYRPVLQGDQVGLHAIYGNCGIPDSSKLTTYSSTVFINGKGVGRIGDEYGLDNIITSGFSKVFIGG